MFAMLGSYGNNQDLDEKVVESVKASMGNQARESLLFKKAIDFVIENGTVNGDAQVSKIQKKSLTYVNLVSKNPFSHLLYEKKGFFKKRFFPFRRRHFMKSLVIRLRVT